MTQDHGPVGLTCPKCQSVMNSQERNGLTIDRCSGCGGVFLDRGELERLIQLEGDHYDQGRRERGEYGEDDEERHEHGQYGQKRRGGLLGELFGG